MSQFIYGKYEQDGYWYEVEYELENHTFDFVYDTSDPYSQVIVKDNIDVVGTPLAPTAFGIRRNYENSRLIDEENAAYTEYSRVVPNDVSLTATVSNLLNSRYGSSASNDILKALRDSVEVHKWTESGVITYAHYNIIQSEVYVKTLCENSRREYQANHNPRATFIPGVSLEWSIWSEAHPNGSAIMPRALAYALLKVNDDILNNLIEVPDYIKPILKDSLPKVGLDDPKRVHWYVNIDGSINPNITLTWASNLQTERMTCSADMSLVTTKTTFLGRTVYNSQPLTWSFTDLYEKSYGSGAIAELKKLWGQIKSYFGVDTKVTLAFKMLYDDSGSVSGDTALCFAEISSDGRCDRYGYLTTEHDGSEVTITYDNTDEVVPPDPIDDSDVPTDPIEDKDPITGKPIAKSGVCLLTKSYLITESRLKQLGDFLWNDDFLGRISKLNQNPIDNIISVKCFPFTMPDIAASADREIVIGNANNTGVYGKPINENALCTFRMQDFTIPTHYDGSFLDYEYTTISLFLPYIGFQTLDTNIYMGKKMRIKYFVDMITGVCKSQVGIVKDSNDFIPVQEFGGQIGIDIALTAYNRAQEEVAQLNSFASGAIKLALATETGNAMQGFMGAKDVMSGCIKPKEAVSTSGSNSPMCNMMSTHDVFIVIQRPVVNYPRNYNHIYGRPLFIEKSLNNCRGFTQCANVDVEGVACDEVERNMIKRYLEEGVIIA